VRPPFVSLLSGDQLDSELADIIDIIDINDELRQATTSQLLLLVPLVIAVTAIRERR
jgi:hypothetical protein